MRRLHEPHAVQTHPPTARFLQRFEETVEQLTTKAGAWGIGMDLHPLDLANVLADRPLATDTDVAHQQQPPARGLKRREVSEVSLQDLVDVDTDPLAVVDLGVDPRQIVAPQRAHDAEVPSRISLAKRNEFRVSGRCVFGHGCLPDPVAGPRTTVSPDLPPRLRGRHLRSHTHGHRG